MGDRRRTYSILMGSLKERDQLKDLGVDGHVILECVLKIGWEGVTWIYFAFVRTSGGLLLTR
jgi:hypothetical protein